MKRCRIGAHTKHDLKGHLVRLPKYRKQILAGPAAVLGIPNREINLEVGSGSHAVQTAEIMKRFEEICLKENPTHVLVVGDVNSTIACSLVASKLEIKVIHVEAGLRSFDRSMPEEMNRVLTDTISDLLFPTEESANENLRDEGIPKEKIFFVGNTMIDTL